MAITSIFEELRHYLQSQSFKACNLSKCFVYQLSTPSYHSPLYIDILVETIDISMFDTIKMEHVDGLCS